MGRNTLTRTVVGTLAAGALVFSTAGACGSDDDQPGQTQQQGGDQDGDDQGGDDQGGDDRDGDDQGGDDQDGDDQDDD